MAIAIDELEGCHEEEGEGEERGSGSRWEQRGSGSCQRIKAVDRRQACVRALVRKSTLAERSRGTITRPIFPLDRWADGKRFP
jgi:hypothetical protein